jgi:glucose-6-phosphate isomerase
MPENVGGRFSVLTSVGMVLAGFAGYDLKQIRSGALSVLDQQSQLLDMASELCQAIENKTDLIFFWSYSSQLRWFNQWLTQLWAESLGKNKTLKNTNSPKIPWLVTATGCSDQHSIFQQILESEQKKYVILTQSLEKFADLGFTKPIFPFFKNQSFNLSDVFIAEREATTEALKEYKIPCADMLFDKYDDYTIGFLFTWFEVLTVLVAGYFGINPYDQPAVALGKKIAKAKLNL